MRTNTRLLPISLLLICGWSDLCVNGATADDRSYILLEHGSVLHGVARPVGDKLEVKIGEGNTVLVDRKQVVQVGASKQSLYDQQTQAIRHWGTEHWHFAQWCIKQQLIDEAIMHYRELAKTVEPTLKFKQLEHDLKIAILESERVKKLIASQTPDTPSTMNAVDKVDDPVNSSDPGVRLASAVEISNSRSLHVPGYVKKAFHQTVAPILISRCGQAGCHGMPGKSDFHIYQATGEQAGDIAAKNLEQVLRYVTPKSPNESPLLAYATRAHGIQKNPRFNPLRDDDRLHVERIAQWIHSIDFSSNTDIRNASVVTPEMSVSPQTLDSSRVVTAASVEPNEAVSEDSSRNRKDRLKELMQTPVEQDRNAKLSKPNKSSVAPGVLANEELAELEKAIETLERRQSITKRKDPFDPNIFNQQFGKK